MKIAVIGHHKSFGCGSIAHRLAEVLKKEHTVYRVPTQTLARLNEEGYERIYNITELIEPCHDLIIVTQSQIKIYNDTAIPLILIKTERADPYGTVRNPTIILKKLEVISDLTNYKNIVFVTIDLERYDIDVEKDLLLSDMQWAGQKFEDYINIMERSQHAIIYQRVHETDCITTRAIEAMACKTIPIIFYHTHNLLKLYGMMGINETNAYFVCTSMSFNLEIKEYDIEMATRGYDLVQKYFGTEVLAAKIMKVVNNGKK